MDPTHDPAIAELLSFFDFAHLLERTPHLAEASAPFHDLAHVLLYAPRDIALEGLADVEKLMLRAPGNEAACAAYKLGQVRREAARLDGWRASVAGWLRTLLEAKDCAVRAALVRHRAERAGEASKAVAVADLPGLLAGLEAIQVRHNEARGVFGEPDDGAVTITAPVSLTRDAHFASWPEHPVQTNGYRVFIDGPITIDPAMPWPFIDSPVREPEPPTED